MADYSINAVTRRVVYTGSAGTGPYAFSFEILVEGDIAVYFNETLLTLTTDYTVSINANGTGSVTIVTGTNVPSTPTASDQITIVGSRDIERTTDFVTAGDFRASAINEQLDSQIIMIQQIAEENQRSMRAPTYDPALVADGGVVDMTLPAKDSRKGKYLAFNTTTGNPEAGASSDDVTTLAAVTTDIATLADIEDGTDATDAIQTVAGISGNVTTVAGISSNVTTVAGISADVTTVAADGADIGTVAGISSDVATVAGISSDVTTVAADGTDIGTVAGISSNVTTVAGISSDVTTVAGISGDVSSVAAQVVGYNFSTTTTMADPGSGNVRFNNATLASVTAIAIDDLDANGVDQSAYIALFDDSTNTVKGTLVFRTGGGDVATFNITGLTDNTGWFQVAVTHVASSGTFSNAEDTFIGFTRAGDKGADGAGSGDVSGPGASVTDNAVVRWDATSGQLVQNSGAILDDSDNLTGLNGITAAAGTFTTFTSTGIDDNASSTAITIDSSGNVGVGTTSPDYNLDISGTTDPRIILQSTGTAGTDDTIFMNRVGGTTATNQIWFGDSGSAETGKLQYDHSNNDMTFHTNGGIERIRILSSGGITFNGDTATANALDDYEEGTFTLTLNGATTTTYTTNSGAYTKIGDIVYVRGILHINSYGDGNGGKIDGFPFASNGESALSIAKINTIQTAVVDISFRISGTSGYFMHRTAASTGETTNPSQMAASGAYLSFAGTYKTS